MYRIYQFIFITVLIGAPFTGLSQSISITNITPESPATLALGQRVEISFTYSEPSGSPLFFKKTPGVRIFVQPFSNGKPTPNFGVSGSPVYKKRGKGTAFFTIRDQRATVDQVRFRMVTADQKQQLFEFRIPVHYSFVPTIKVDTDILNQFPLNKKDQEKKNKAVHVMTTTGNGNTGGEAKIEKKIVKPDGTIETHYTDGTIRGFTPDSTRYEIDPATGDTMFTIIKKIEAQSADKPVSPPGFVATSGDDASDKWLASLNSWIEKHAERLLNSIEAQLTSEESVKNYLEYEEKNSSNIYEKIEIRYRFLVQLSTYNSSP